MNYESTSNNTRSVGGGGVEVTHGALFNGIGGFQLAAAWCGWENVFSVEIDKWCNKVTAQHFPNCKQYENIYDFDGKEYEVRIDIISGGFPCQPFSVAGKRKGAEDDRHLWPEMLRVISEVKPSWVVAENVSGLLAISGGLVFEQVLSDLENAGYEVQPYIIPACATNAPHRRDRVWIVANTNSVTNGIGQTKIHRNACATIQIQLIIDTQSTRRESGTNRQREIELGRSRTRISWEQDEWPAVATALCRMDDGLSRQVDRAKRLKALGNAIVPQVAFELFNGIHLLETNKENN